MRASRLLPAALLVVAMSACESDPNLPETWVAQLSAKTKKEKLTAIERLRKLCDGKDDACRTNRNAKATAAVAALLKEGGEVRVDAARTLGVFKDVSAVPALIDAIDMGVGTGQDPASKEANEGNKEIARSLAELGDKNAVKPLADLATRSKDNFAKVAAIEALGALKDQKAVEPLMKIATDENVEPYVNKKAILALGEIGDPAATPAIVKMLFHERKGLSFYPESSFAVYQIGPTATPPILTVLEGKDEPLKAWAAEHDIFQEALLAKASQVLGDLGEPKAIPILRKYLSYKAPDALREGIVRMQAVEALGRMRATEAAPEIAKLLTEEEANLRGVYTRALTSIGDRSVQPAMIACAKKGDPMDKRGQAREACYVGLSQLGDEKALAQWEAWQKEEPKASADACMKEMEFEGADGKAQAQAHCDALAGNVVKLLEMHKPRLVAYGECKQDRACWENKLKDPEPKIRERAATELGRMGDPAALPALAHSMKETDLNARYAAVIAGHWVVDRGPEGVKAGKALLADWDKQLEEEKGKVHYVKINEDLKRLVVKIRRLDK